MKPTDVEGNLRRVCRTIEDLDAELARLKGFAKMQASEIVRLRGMIARERIRAPRCSRCGRFKAYVGGRADLTTSEIEDRMVGDDYACSRQACLDAAEAAYEAFHERQEERRGR